MGWVRLLLSNRSKTPHKSSWTNWAYSYIKSCRRLEDKFNGWHGLEWFWIGNSFKSSYRDYCEELFNFYKINFRSYLITLFCRSLVSSVKSYLKCMCRKYIPNTRSPMSSSGFRLLMMMLLFRLSYKFKIFNTSTNAIPRKGPPIDTRISWFLYF